MADPGQAFGVSGGLLFGLAAALGSGLLIGLERERHKRRGTHREPARPSGPDEITLRPLEGVVLGRG